MKRSLFLFALFLLLLITGDAWASSRRGKRPLPPLELLWYVEDAQGVVTTSKGGEQRINPASVVKVATALWALEKLGPNLVLETRFFARNGVDWEKGRVKGDLVVQGGADPDFHLENAFLVAKALNELGIREVGGAVVVNSQFWMGWENGSAGTERDPIKRGLKMASLLRQAIDTRRWTNSIRRAWREIAKGRGWPKEAAPSVKVRGGVGADGRSNLGDLLLIHRSKPLLLTLHRFNAYSNNDIERLGVLLGPPAELVDLLQARPSLREEKPEFATLSGLGENRLSLRGIVRLVRELAESCRQHNVELEAVLPVAGCHPGTLAKFFPNLNEPPFAAAVAGKTGTLTNTDGGISVFAGVAHTFQGEYFFCLACPKARGRLGEARKLQQAWLVRFIKEHGGPLPRTCASNVVEADEGSLIISVAKPQHKLTSEGNNTPGGSGARP